MNLFTYGTLMDAAVWERVGREKCRTERAVLEGYEPRRLRGVPWPGLVKAASGRTRGLLYRDVSSEAMARLDAYEDDGYIRTPVEVTAESGGTIVAEVYLLAPHRQEMALAERWEPPPG